MTGILTSRRSCPRKSGGNDPPCSCDPEKGEDMEDRETADLSLRLGRPTMYSLYLTNGCITSRTRTRADSRADSGPSQTSARNLGQ
jgi:hypothetical protein